MADMRGEEMRPFTDKSVPSPHVGEHASANSSGYIAPAHITPASSRALPRKRFWHTWYLEVIAAILMPCSLAAIIIYAAVQDGKEITTNNYYVSLNTYISVFSVILKTSLMFVVASGISQLKWAWFSSPRPLIDLHTIDDATRGPLGAFRLFFNLRAWSLPAYVGAFITLVALVVDPFAQQLVFAKSCTLQRPNLPASIPRTNFFDDRQLSLGSEFSAPVSYGLQNALVYSLYNSKPTQVTPVCPYGSCTYPDFYTTGLCSTCRDVSDQLIVQNYTYQSQGATQQHTSYNFSGSSDPRLSGFREVSLRYDSLSPETLETVLESTNNASLTGPSGFMNMSSFNTNFTVLTAFLQGSPWLPPHYGRSTCSPDEVDWQCQGYGAATCEIDVCVRHMSASVTNGTLKETVISEFYIPSSETAPIVVNRTCADIAVAASSVSPQTISSLLSTQPLGIYEGHPMYLVNPGNETLMLQYPQVFESCAFGFDANAWSTLKLYIPDNYYGTTVVSQRQFGSGINPSTEDGTTSFWDADLADTSLEAYTPDSVLQSKSSPFVGPVYRQGNITFATVNASLSAMALGASSYIRQHGFAGFNASQSGTTLAYSSCYEVRWLWLIYPAAILGLGLLFAIPLAIAALADKLGPGRDWKSSALPLLVYPLEDTAAEHADHEHGEESRGVNIMSLDAVETMAKRRHVVFGLNNDGAWRFRNV